jgi:hypothetical protein
MITAWLKNILAAELGNENKTTDDDRVNFVTKGSYLKVGFDYNCHENWLIWKTLFRLVCARVSVPSINNWIRQFYNQSHFQYLYSFWKFEGLSASWIREVMQKLKFLIMFLWDSVFKIKPIGYKEPDNFFKPYIPIQPNLRCSFELDLITVFVPIFKKEPHRSW